MESSCLELALEGERLCKVGDYRAGVSFFESAIQVGTEDLQILSAIYSQLGNAYFHLQEYGKALEYHHHDLTLTRYTWAKGLNQPGFAAPTGSPVDTFVGGTQRKTAGPESAGLSAKKYKEKKKKPTML